MKRMVLAAALIAACSDSGGGASTQTGTNIRTENGVMVVKAPQDMWCGESNGRCELTVENCTRRWGQCAVASDYSCMQMQTRTSSSTVIACFTTYGQCKALEDAARRDPELKEMKVPCAIFRKDAN